MIALEVYRNDQKLRTAGVGEYGLIRSMVQYLSHAPSKLARWAQEGMPERGAVSLKLDVSGCVGEERELEHWSWASEPLETGDEILIRIVDVSQADPPTETRRDDADLFRKMEARYVRRKAKELGWKIVT